MLSVYVAIPKSPNSAGKGSPPTVATLSIPRFDVSTSCF